jgi:hypothetical protein
MERSVNILLLKSKIEELGLAKASILTDVSISTLEKLRAGSYKSKLSRRVVEKICKGLKVKLDEIWPATKAS